MLSPFGDNRAHATLRQIAAARNDLSASTDTRRKIVVNAAGYLTDAGYFLPVVYRLQPTPCCPQRNESRSERCGGPFGVHIEYERYEVVGADLDAVSVGLQANF